MTSSLPDGFRVRPARESDIEAAAAIIHAEERSVRGGSAWGVNDIADFWRLANLSGGSWVVERDGAPVAFAAGIERESALGCWAAVHPDAGGCGLATWLLARAGERAQELGL